MPPKPKDERRKILAGLRGNLRLTDHDPLEGLAETIGLQVLPPVDVETAVRRLLHVLKADAFVYRKVLNEAAEAAHLYVTAEDPKAPKGSRKVDAMLKEIDQTSVMLQEWAGRMQRNSRALVVRSEDPGVKDPKACCDRCGMPNLLIVSVDQLEQNGQSWAVVLVTDEVEEEWL